MGQEDATIIMWCTLARSYCCWLLTHSMLPTFYTHCWVGLISMLNATTIPLYAFIRHQWNPFIFPLINVIPLIVLLKVSLTESYSLGLTKLRVPIKNSFYNLGFEFYRNNILLKLLILFNRIASLLCSLFKIAILIEWRSSWMRR
jgi:hypothetical protein